MSEYEILPKVDVPLSPGASSTVVWELQKTLEAFGLYSYPVDGKVGPATLAGVDAAWKAFAHDPSLYVRDLVQGGWDALTAGQVLKVLQQATAANDALVANDSALNGLPDATKPIVPDEEIVMTTEMLIAAEQRATMAPRASGGIPAWVFWGAGLATVGALAIGASRRRG
jgi:peptidoglycan hydrolase-like protein with peptidoglycan-binding domain